MSESQERPQPLVPSDCDLLDSTVVPIDVLRLFNSRFHAVASDAEWRAGVTLWLKSFQQLPAASLPNDDVELCRLAEFGRDMTAWLQVKEAALQGWILCDDGRLYHPWLAEKAREAWRRKQVYRERSRKANAARWGDRRRRDDPSRSPSSTTRGEPQGSPASSRGRREAPAAKIANESACYDDDPSRIVESGSPPHPPSLSHATSLSRDIYIFKPREREGSEREGQGREGQGREGPGREGPGREGSGREGSGREGQGREGPGREGPAPSAKTPRGTRLPEDWIPPDIWLEWAMRERGWTKGDALKVAEIFRDYWVAKSGADARKADWGATWRNWVRREGLRPKMPQSARAPWPAYRAEPVRENPRRLIL